MGEKRGSNKQENLWLDKNFVSSKRSQVTIFIIIAIVIVAGVAIYFVFRERIMGQEIPTEFRPVEEYFLGCVEDYTGAGVSMLGEGGGYIYLPDFVPGSGFSPSSNYLDFLGTSIPFWYYLSGNNLVGQQVPSVSDMEDQLSRYLNENLACDFSGFRQQGFIVNLDKIESEVEIRDNQVLVNVNANLNIGKNEESVLVTNHQKQVSSSLGSMYKEAKSIYDNEQERNLS